MASNKFATVLHRNTHKMAAILVYAVLEWTLILLLLLNGVFAYLIARFAAYFGLQPPCVFCSRVDHLFEPGGDGRRQRRRMGSACCDLVCDRHAAEVAGLVYCARHRRLAEAGEMCEHCCASSSRPPAEPAAVLSWMKRSEEGEEDLRCSCCDVVLESGFYSPYLLFNPSSGALEYDQKGNLVEEIAVGDRQEDAILCREKLDAGELVSPDQAHGCSQKEEEIEEKVGRENALSIIAAREVEEEVKEEDLIHFSDACRLVDDPSSEVLAQHPGNMYDEERLVPVELIDATTMKKSPVANVLVKQDQRELGHVGGEEDGRVLDIGSISEARYAAVVSASEKTDGIEESSSGHGELEQDTRALDVGSITEEEKRLVSAAEMADIVVVNPLGNDRAEQEAMVLDVGCIVEEEKAVASAAEIADVVKENSSEDVAADQNADAFDIRSMVEEEKALATAEERADTIEDNSSKIDEAQHCDITLDVRSIPEQKAFASAKERADTIEHNSSEMDEAQQCAMTLDITRLSEEEKALASAGERPDTIEKNSSVMDGAQQCTVALGLRSISEEEAAFTFTEERADNIDEKSSEMDGAEQRDITLDIGNFSEEEKVLASRTQGNDILEQKSVVLPASEPIDECSSDHQPVAPQATSVTTLGDGGVVQMESLVSEEDLPGTKTFEEGNKLMDVEANCEISRGSEVCDQEHIDHTHIHDPILMSESTPDQLSEIYNGMTSMDQDISVSETEPVATTAQGPDHIAVFPENNEIEEERVPETPTYIDGIHGLSKRFLFGRRESGTESLDGSVASELEGCDTLTAEQLKAALRVERKALSALYSEFEEERSAAAIAANQTMAMITRLQEEKAAMQMEALQYQRMMEEQSEYDQEALHLLNELMIKREKEKQDLEKELEMYRKRVLRYEFKERRDMAKHKVNGRVGTSSASSSAEESDDLSFEFHEGDEFAYNANESNENTPVSDVLSSGRDQGTAKHLITLKDSLADFDEERLSILEQLKALERKLIILDDEDSRDLEAIEQIPDENCHVSNGSYEPYSDDLHDDVNGFSDDLEPSRKQHSERRIMGCKGKKLLRLFDAVSNENEDDVYTKEEAVDVSCEMILSLAEEQKKLAIVEEVDNIYERLEALEGDREFFKHCINSLKKGDKGIHLLQEILENLRDLRSVEVRARNS